MIGSKHLSHGEADGGTHLLARATTQSIEGGGPTVLARSNKLQTGESVVGKCNRYSRASTEEALRKA